VRALAKLTALVDGEPRIVGDPPLIVPAEDLVRGRAYAALEDGLLAALHDYQETLPAPQRRLLARYRPVHFARKVVGVGSVGTSTWIALLLGRDAGDPLFLQVKEAQPSVLEPYLGASGYASQGERVVAGQRLLQAAGDAFLGWKRDVAADGRRRDFYVRQLHDWKGSASVDRATPQSLRRYGQLCGWALARAHARTGDPIALAAYLGAGDAFDAALAAFAEAYADQTERDHRALGAAVESGRLRATTGL
jgi:hypothetical protein